MKINTKIPLLLIAGSVLLAQAQNTPLPSTNTVQDYLTFSPDDLLEQKIKAIKGDEAAAVSLYKYYSVFGSNGSKSSMSSGIEWAIIAARLNSSFGKKVIKNRLEDERIPAILFKDLLEVLEKNKKESEKGGK